MHALFAFLFFTALVGFFTWLIVRKDNCDSNDGFFLAGRSLSFPFIAGSLLLTNLSTEQLVGLNGQAFSNGLSVMAWEVVAVIGLILMALFFLPRFLKSGITTVPQYLEMRFGSTTGTIANFIFLLAYMLILLPMVLYTGAQELLNMLDIHALLGLPEQTLGIDTTYLTFVGIIVVIALIGAIYALFGGLRTVVVSDTLNGIGLLIGGLMIVFFGLAFIGKMSDGGVLEGLNTIYGDIPEQFNSIGAMNQDVPFPTLFSGILIINIFYWCTNQQIIQRTLGAKSLAEGQKGVLLTGLLKLLGPLYLVLPGIIGYYLYKNNIIEVGYKLDNKTLNSDVVYGLLVRQVLPAGLTGFFAAVMMGAILSSFNSALNSTCTIFSLGIYKKYINPDATEHKVVRVSQYFGWLITLGAVIVAPMLLHAGGIFNYLQKMNAIYFIPLLAVILVGMLTRRVPEVAANWALIGGIILIAIGYFCPPFNNVVTAMNEYQFVAVVFTYLVIFMLVMGEVKPRATEYIQKDARVLDLTPWRYTKLSSLLLMIFIVVIYVMFADFSVFA